MISNSATETLWHWTAAATTVRTSRMSRNCLAASATARPEDAIAHGLELAAAGADIVDVGGESTRPGALRISQDEELRRVGPGVAAPGPGGVGGTIGTTRAPRAAHARRARARRGQYVSGRA